MKKDGMTRREFMRALIVAAVSAGAAGAEGITNSPALKNTPSAVKPGRTVFVIPPPSRPGSFRVAIVGMSHCSLPLIHALGNGHFPRFGIDVEIIPVPDYSDAVYALDKGEIHAAQISAPFFYALHMGTGPFKDNPVPLVSLQCAGTDGGSLLVSERTGIFTPNRLGGRVIGIAGNHLVQTMLLEETLKRSGLDPAKDVELKSFATGDLVSAMQRGEIDACMALEPYATTAIQSGLGREIAGTSRIWHNHPCCYIAMRRDKFMSSPTQAISFYSATILSSMMLHEPGQSRDDALTLIQKDPRKIPVDTYRAAIDSGRVGFDPFPYKSAGRALLMLMKANGIMAGPANPTKLVPETLIMEQTRMILGTLGLKAPQKDDRREIIAGMTMF